MFSECCLNLNLGVGAVVGSRKAVRMFCLDLREDAGLGCLKYVADRLSSLPYKHLHFLCAWRNTSQESLALINVPIYATRMLESREPSESESGVEKKKNKRLIIRVSL